MQCYVFTLISEPIQTLQQHDVHHWERETVATIKPTRHIVNHPCSHMLIRTWRIRVRSSGPLL